VLSIAGEFIYFAEIWGNMHLFSRGMDTPGLVLSKFRWQTKLACRGGEREGAEKRD